MKLVGGSAGISIFIDLIIGLVHGLFNKEKINKDLYEVRTRKILLISNSIASTSNIIQTMITKNPKNLDIGGTIGYPFSFIHGFKIYFPNKGRVYKAGIK